MDIAIAIIISWFVVGLISVILLFAIDLRGQPYNENYFKDKFAPTLFAFLCGYISLIFVFFAYNDEKKFLQKLIYKIVNIGIDTKTDEFEDKEE